MVAADVSRLTILGISYEIGADSSRFAGLLQFRDSLCLLAIYRSCATGYDGRASAFALLQRDKATRPYRLGNVPIIIGKWHQLLPAQDGATGEIV